MNWIVISIILFFFALLWYRRSRTISPTKNSVPAQEKQSKQYQAITINPCSHACEAIHWIKDKRYLASEAPELPINMCTNGEKCQCKYSYHNDRRSGDGDRRLSSAAITNSFSFNNQRSSARKDRRRDSYA
jgi:hypothetical protein